MKFVKKYYIYAILVLLTPAALLLDTLCRGYPAFTDYVYSRRIYPVLAAVISPVTGLIPLSVAELLIYCAIILCIYFLIKLIINIRKVKLKNICMFFLKLVSTASVGYFLFTIMWSLNYYRLPLDNNLSYKTGSVTKEMLSSILTSETSCINALCPHINYDAKQHSYYPGGIFKMQRQTNNGFKKLASQNSLFNGIAAHPKGVLLSQAMSVTGTDGIFIPFTYEPCVSIVCPQFMIPSNMAHEAAHFKGFAKEDEANFISYLANIDNDDIYFQYSAHMFAFMYVSNALHDTDADLWNQAASKLDPKASSDIEYYNQYANRFAGPVQNISQQINNTYLKAQGQQQGVISYNMFVNLLCDRYRTESSK